MTESDKKLLVKKLGAGVFVAIICSIMAVVYLSNKDIFMAAIFAYGGYDLFYRSFKWFKQLQSEQALVDLEVADEIDTTDEGSIEPITEDDLVGDGVANHTHNIHTDLHDDSRPNSKTVLLEKSESH